MRGGIPESLIRKLADRLIEKSASRIHAQGDGEICPSRFQNPHLISSKYRSCETEGATAERRTTEGETLPARGSKGTAIAREEIQTVRFIEMEFHSAKGGLRGNDGLRSAPMRFAVLEERGPLVDRNPATPDLGHE